MHLCDDLNVIELVGSSGRATQPGETSDIVRLTVLYNRLMPLIRYEIDDRFRLAAETCRCGSRFRRLADVEGRAQDAFTYEGATVQQGVFLVVLGRDRRIIQYQVRQTAGGAEIDVVAPAGIPREDLHDLEAELVQALIGQGLPQAAVTIRLVDGILRLASGKQPRFVPLQ